MKLTQQSAGNQLFCIAGGLFFETRFFIGYLTLPLTNSLVRRNALPGMRNPLRSLCDDQPVAYAAHRLNKLRLFIEPAQLHPQGLDV